MNPGGSGAPAFAADKPIVSAKALAGNARSANFVRSLMFVYAGCIAGVVGVTGLYGFAFYLVVYGLVSVSMLVRMSSNGASVRRYFLSKSPLSFALSGVASQLVTFILFWTLTYALVHLY